MKTKNLLIGSLFIPLTSVGSMIIEVLYYLCINSFGQIGVNKYMNDKQFVSNEMYLGIKDHIHVVWYPSKGALGILMDRTQQ